MEWTEDAGLAKRIAADIAGEIDKGQERYHANMPHLSELIYCLTAKWYDRFRPLPLTQRETMLFTSGIELEKVVLRPHKKPKGGELGGVFWNADFLDYAEGLGELKTTRISMKKLPENMPLMWVRQMLFYMKANNVQEVSLAAFHLMGDYAPPFPTLKCWHGSATQQEIDQNYAWVMMRKNIFMHHAEIGEPPPQFKYNEDWECDYGPCRYLIICQANQSIEDLRGK